MNIKYRHIKYQKTNSLGETTKPIIIFFLKRTYKLNLKSKIQLNVIKSN